MKYVYVGDPKGEPHSSGKCRMSIPSTGERFVFEVGKPVEVPDWVEEAVKNNSHFKRVEESKPLSLGDKSK